MFAHGSSLFGGGEKKQLFAAVASSSLFDPKPALFAAATTETSDLFEWERPERRRVQLTREEAKKVDSVHSILTELFPNLGVQDVPYDQLGLLTGEHLARIDKASGGLVSRLRRDGRKGDNLRALVVQEHLSHGLASSAAVDAGRPPPGTGDAVDGDGI